MGDMWTKPLTTPISYVYINDLLVKPVYMKVVKEGESKYTVVAFFFY